MMKTDRRYTEEEILAKVRATFAPLTYYPVWSRDHDCLGFLIQDNEVRRGVRLAPVRINILKQDDQLKKFYMKLGVR
jgi:hypothetical protein